MKKLFISFFIITLFFSCVKSNKVEILNDDYIFKAPISSEPLPDDLIWLTNDSDPVFASSEAKKGGTMRSYLLSFPNTFRSVGPDSNNGFRSYIDANRLSLITLHPNTENIIPALATHWAYGDDNKTMFFKLNPKARWSDGTPITAHDYAYTFEFMKSKYIVAPWYNDQYNTQKDKVVVYNDYTISVSLKNPKPDLWFYIDISPRPRHFYGKLNENFVKEYNWKIEPNTGPYQITKFEKGKYIIFERKKDWWAKDLKYFKNRFNVDKVIFKVIKDTNLTWEYFKNQEIDVHGLTHAYYWHEKSDIDIFKNGYVHKIWFFNNIPQGPWGFYLNQDKEIFKDKNIRYAFAHGMNFDLVNEKVLRNEYYRLNHAYVGYGKYSNNNIEARKYDIEKVKYYMGKSGWQLDKDGIWEKDNKKFSVIVTYTKYDLDTQRLVILKEEAKKAGIDLQLEALDSAADYKKIIEKKHEIAWMQWSTSYRPSYWQGYHSDNAHKPQTNNITNTDDKELDELIMKYRDSYNESERINLSHIIQQKLHEEGSFVPAFMYPYVRQAYWRWWRLPEVSGTKWSDSIFEPFDSSTGGLFWYDEKLHKETLNAMKKGIKLEPVTIIDKTYMMDIIEGK